MAANINNTPPVQSDADLQRQLLLLDLEERLEKKKQKTEEEDQRKAVRFASANEHNKKRLKELHDQATCAHRKPDQRTAVVVCRDSNNVEIGICQRCSKEMGREDMIRLNLRPEDKQIGGPLPSGMIF